MKPYLPKTSATLGGLIANLFGRYSFENSFQGLLRRPCFKHDLEPETFQTFDEAASEAHGIETVEVIGSEFVIFHTVFQNLLGNQQKRMSNGNRGSFDPATPCQSTEQGRKIIILRGGHSPR